MLEEPQNMSLDELWAALPESEGYRRGDILYAISQHQMPDDPTSAESTVTQAAEVFESAGFHREQSWCIDALAHIRSHQGDERSAHELHLKVLSMHDATTESSDRAHALYCAGQSASTLDLHHEAIEHLLEAQTLFEDATPQNSHTLGDLYVELGNLYSWIGGHLDIARDYLTKAFDMGCHDLHATVRLRYLLTINANDSGLHTEALEHARRALSVARSHDCVKCEMPALYQVARSLEWMGQVYEAISLYNELAEIAKRERDNTHIIRVKLARARMSVNENPEGARTMAHDALILAEDSRLRVAARAANSTLAQIASVMGNHELAISYLDSVIEASTKHNVMSSVYIAQRKKARELIALGRASEAVSLLRENGWVADVITADSSDRADHVALYARALVASKRTNEGLAVAEQLLEVLADRPHSPAQAVAHHVRAEVLRHRNPVEAEHAAGKALAYYTLARDHKAASDVAFEYFCLPVATLKAVATDHDRRVSQEQLVDELHDVAMMTEQDPIEAQVAKHVAPQEAEREGGAA
jgi:tetratricopeptide (TPR) repeat protein